LELSRSGTSLSNETPHPRWLISAPPPRTHEPTRERTMTTQERVSPPESQGPDRWSIPDESASPSRRARDESGPTVAQGLQPVVSSILGNETPLRFEFWDGSALGPDGGAGSLSVRSPRALRRILWAPGELGLARGFVTGELELHGDLIGVLRALRNAVPQDRLRTPIVRAFHAARRVGALGLPL
jgi:hypothetical protein